MRNMLIAVLLVVTSAFVAAKDYNLEYADGSKVYISCMDEKFSFVEKATMFANWTSLERDYWTCEITQKAAFDDSLMNEHIYSALTKDCINDKDAKALVKDLRRGNVEMMMMFDRNAEIAIFINADNGNWFAMFGEYKE